MIEVAVTETTISEPRPFSQSEFMEFYRVGKATFHAEVQDGRLKPYKVGRRWYVTVDAARAWQRSLQELTIYKR